MAKVAGGEFDGTGPSVDGLVNPADLGAPGGSGGSGGPGSGDDFDPAIHIGRDKINGDGSFKRKRGRKPGSGAGTSAGPLNLSGIESVLTSMHMMLAVATQTPELALDDKESKAITEAIAEVARHYPMTIDPKALAWGNLVMAMTMVYGPRVYNVRARRKKEAKAPPKTDAQILPFGTVN